MLTVRSVNKKSKTDIETVSYPEAPMIWKDECKIINENSKKYLQLLNEGLTVDNLPQLKKCLLEWDIAVTRAAFQANESVSRHQFIEQNRKFMTNEHLALDTFQANRYFQDCLAGTPVHFLRWTLALDSLESRLLSDAKIQSSANTLQEQDELTSKMRPLRQLVKSHRNFISIQKYQLECQQSELAYDSLKTEDALLRWRQSVTRLSLYVKSDAEIVFKTKNFNDIPLLLEAMKPLRDFVNESRTRIEIEQSQFDEKNAKRSSLHKLLHGSKDKKKHAQEHAKSNDYRHRN